jgi:hypothetical protein
MDRAAVFVDAGYLFAAGSKLIAGETLSRGAVDLNHDRVLAFLGQLATDLTGLPLLRIYWYDGTSSGPTTQQLALAYRPNIKVRLGFVNALGHQKGVDSLIVTDLINLARNRAMADAVLVTGDEDIRVGVQQAQEFGIRVHLVGIAPARSNQSGFLVQEADNVRELSGEEVATFLSRSVIPLQPTLPVQPAVVSVQVAVAPPPAGDSGALAVPSEDQDVLAQLEMVALDVAHGLAPEEIAALLRQNAGVPPEVDRQLLKRASSVLGGQLSQDERRQVRDAFFAACRASVAHSAAE